MADKKLTKRDRYTQLLALSEVANDTDLTAFIKHEIELLDKHKASGDGEKALTATQKQNLVLVDELLAFFQSKPDTVMTITDITKTCPTCADNDLSGQRVTALVKKLVDAGKVKRSEVKGKAYFSLA